MNYSKRQKRRTALTGTGVFAVLLLVGVILTAWAIDGDNDGMSDDYENLFHLNPTNAADAVLNYDGDSLINAQEAALWTDPWVSDTDLDGWNDDVDSNPVSRAFIPWGEPSYTTGDTIEYTWPAWMLSAFGNGGEWVTNPTAWHVSSGESNGIGSLNMDVDHAILTNDIRLEVSFFDHTNAELRAYLYDTNDNEIASVLSSNNLLTGTATTNISILDVPLESHSEAVGVRLQRISGEITVYDSLLYVDKDGDGLDKDQEAQLSTSDNSTDSDGDGLSDYAEVFTYGTDPANPDTDNDGMGDGEEVFNGKNPLSYDTYMALPFTELFETNTTTLGLLHGKNGWTASPTNSAMVQTQVVYQGTQAVKIAASSKATASHLIAAEGQPVVWADLYMRYQPATAPTGMVTDSAALFFNSNGQMVVCDGGSWITQTNHTPLTTGQWARVTVKLDYSTQKWLVALDSLLVASGLAFADSVPEFSRIAVDAKKGYVDDVKLSTTVPGDLSLDGDSLPDGWEMQYFGNLAQTDNGDPDGDGLSNLEEYQHGTDPTKADSDNDGLSDGVEVNTYGTSPTDSDSDNDGMGDGTEVYYGESPTSSNSYSVLPFTEYFETNTAVSIGQLNGQNAWTAAPPALALVQSDVVYEGAQALRMGDVTNATQATAAHLVGAAGQSVVWADLWMRVYYGVAPTGALTDSAVFYFGADGRPVVRDGTQWVALTNAPVSARGSWVRVTVKLDYSAQEWALCLDDIVVADGLAFASSVPEFNRVSLDAKYTYADNVCISTGMPSGISMDWDHLPDAWEMQYFGNLNQTDNGDPDGDGLSNLEEYQHSTDPTKADSDYDGLNDWYEVYVSGTNPLNNDTDGDTLNDAWEIRYGMDPLTWNNPNADSDSDTLTDYAESTNGAAGTNPFLADSDGDGVSDYDEIYGTVKTDPLVADQHPTGGPTVEILYPKDEEYILW